MFATKSRIATTIMAMALTSTGIFLMRYSTNHAESTNEMFPDGLAHDFGKVRSGIQAEHAFRVVNTSDVPLRIVSVRCSMGPLRGRSTKDMLLPKEEGTVEIVLDTKRFRGHKTCALYLLTENGNSVETRFTVTADSQENRVVELFQDVWQALLASHARGASAVPRPPPPEITPDKTPDPPSPAPALQEDQPPNQSP